MSNRIKELRKKAGLTQAELAKQSGVPRVSIQRYETGATTPSVDRAATIAATLAVPVEQMIGSTEPEKDESGDQNAAEAV